MYKKPSKNFKKATSINWKKWLLIITGIILLFPLMRFLIRQFAKFKEVQTEISNNTNYQQNQNPIIAQNKADKITVRKDVQNSAKKLAHDLGTKYSDQNSWFDWIDPRGWTENDKAVADVLIYQRNNFTLLKKLYNQVYTNNRSLTDDIFALLDPDELKRVQSKLKIT